MNSKFGSYKANSIRTASREQILLMLYDGAIGFLRQAKTAMEERRIGEKGRLINRAYAIVFELNACLNPEANRVVAENLSALYLFFLDRLRAANASCDPAVLDPVIDTMDFLRDTWAEAIEIARTEQAAEGGERRGANRAAASLGHVAA